MMLRESRSSVSEAGGNDFSLRLLICAFERKGDRNTMETIHFNKRYVTRSDKDLRQNERIYNEPAEMFWYKGIVSNEYPVTGKTAEKCGRLE
jgi:hypothetical protein